jgi:hypothetical protein
MALDHHLKRKVRLILETPNRSSRSGIGCSERYIEPSRRER